MLRYRNGGGEDSSPEASPRRSKGVAQSLSVEDLNQSRTLLMSQTLNLKNGQGSYGAAVGHFERTAYRKKLGEDYFEEYVFWGSNEQVKEFGLGVYFFVEFLKRVVVAYFFMALLSSLTVGFCLTGQRFEVHPASYNQLLSRTTIGNLSSREESLIYWVAVPDCLNILIFLGMVVFWRLASDSLVESYYNDKQCCDPRKYTLVVDGFDDVPV
jgi:hypothetical protein